MPTFIRLSRTVSFDFDQPLWLGAACTPFDAAGESRSNLKLTVNANRLGDRRQLLLGLDQIRREVDQKGLMAGIGFDRTRLKVVAEGALKYYLFGGMSAAFLLFGFSYLYGLAGSTNLHQIMLAMYGPNAVNATPLLYVALVMITAGLGFKVAAVPFPNAGGLAADRDPYANPAAPYMATRVQASGKFPEPILNTPKSITVLTKDITTVPEEEIKTAKVVFTIVGGRVVYRQEP
jgi:hypothetical protein